VFLRKKSVLDTCDIGKKFKIFTRFWTLTHQLFKTSEPNRNAEAKVSYIFKKMGNKTGG
jgi:hypothetical protein